MEIYRPVSTTSQIPAELGSLMTSRVMWSMWIFLVEGIDLSRMSPRERCPVSRGVMKSAGFINHECLKDALRRLMEFHENTCCVRGGLSWPHSVCISRKSMQRENIVVRSRKEKLRCVRNYELSVAVISINVRY